MNQASEEPLTDLADEEVVVAEARVLAARAVEWFRERLRIAEGERDAANEWRMTAEDSQRVAEAERDAADQRRMSAEDSQRVLESQRKTAQQRVVEVEELLAASEELAEQLQQALDSRIIIEQAKGMLAERHGVTPDTAFDAIRRHARNTRQPLRDVASALIAGENVLEM